MRSGCPSVSVRPGGRPAAPGLCAREAHAISLDTVARSRPGDRPRRRRAVRGARLPPASGGGRDGTPRSAPARPRRRVGRVRHRLSSPGTARGPGRAGGRGAPSKQRRRGPSSGRRAVCCACQIIRVASRGAGAGAGRAQAAASSISRAAGAGRSGSRASVPAAHCTALRLSLLLAYWQQLPCVPMAPHLRYPLSIPCSRVQRRDVSGAAERASLHGGLGVPSRRRRYLVWPLCARGEERGRSSSCYYY